MRPTGQEMHHFLLLTPDEQRSAILRLADSGYSDAMIAAATRLAVEQVRAIVGDRRKEVAS